MSLFHAKVRSGGIGRTLTSLLLAVLMILLVILGIQSAAQRSREEGVRVLENNLRRAAVQCYALEGIYPPSVEYLSKNMGIAVDLDKYNVFYEGFASNIMPQITVTIK